MIVAAVAQMLYYLIAAGLIAHTYFWGTGLAKLILPWRWQPWWWVFAPGFGLALQSAVVWAGAHTSLAGTNRYAWWSELLPLVLLLAGLARRGIRRDGRTWRSLLRSSALPVAGLAVIGAWFLLSPMVAAGKGISPSSLGSCDHADYAAGARVLAEFSRHDRTGMMGLVEVTHVGSVDYFFDFWLRLNHFTPSALVAHNSAIFGLEIYRLISLTASVLLLLTIPLVYLLSRIVAALKPRVAFFVAGIYAISPLGAYAVHQGALGQLLAAQGIGLLSLGLALQFREPNAAHRLWPTAGVMLAAFWLLAGSYNFILVICLAQAAPWLLGRSWLLGKSRALVRAATATGVGLLICVVLFWPRFAGIIERFQLFADHDYGWRVPLLTWEGWLGLVGDVYLEAVAPPGRALIMVVLAAGWIGWLLWAGRHERARAISSAALVLPVAAGWTILAWESLTRTNASYDAFKIISVFYPGLLAGLCSGLLLTGKTWRARASLVFVVLVTGWNLVRAAEFREKMSAPPLRVDKHMVGLGRIEQMADVPSVNVRVSLYWARLWADAFLLRVPHYFSEPAYEGRNLTPLRGEWDLRYTLFRILPANAADWKDLGSNFYLVRPESVAAVQAEFGAGWNPAERTGTSQWRWSTGTGHIQLTNTAGQSLRLSLHLQTMGLRRGDSLTVQLNGQPVFETRLNSVPDWAERFEITLPAGPSTLALVPDAQNQRASFTDERKLGIGVQQLVLQLLPVTPL